MNLSLENNPICSMLGIKYPIIIAPMFLVTNEAMIVAGYHAGVSVAIPALNYRTTEEFHAGIKRLKNLGVKSFGVNLIVNKSNFFYKEQLRICCEEQVPYLITSLGSPENAIQEAHRHGIKVFCDVTDLSYAKKVESLGADALIAVNSQAGGHAGSISLDKLIPELKNECRIPVISAGGVGNAESLSKVLQLGADAVSVGSIFIASDEAGVSPDYKQAVVDYGAKDIVMTTKLSGTPCSVIRTPYVETIGTDQNKLEKLLNRSKTLKKWAKALTFYQGMQSLRKAAFSATYKTVWCAGPSIEYVKEIRPIQSIVQDLAGAFK